MRTILLTGAGGFVGARLADQLANDPTIRLVRLVRAGGNDIARDTFCHALENLTARYWLEHGLERIDAVLHVAAFTPKSRDQASSIEPIVAGNIRGLDALLRSLPSIPEYFQFVSSIDVYSLDGHAIDEESPVSPATLYGASKAFGEQMVREYARSVGARYSIARLGHVFGPGEERYRKVVPNLIRSMLRGEQPTLQGTGAAKRDFLYIDDAVAALMALAKHPESVDAVNLVRGESTSVLQLAHLIAERIGCDTTFRFSGADGPSLVFNAKNMHALMAGHSFMDLRDGLEREIDYFRKIPQG